MEGNKGDKVNKPRSIDAFLSSTNYDELCGLHLFTDSAASTPSALLRVSLNGLYVDADFNAEFAEISQRTPRGSSVLAIAATILRHTGGLERLRSVNTGQNRLRNLLF